MYVCVRIAYDCVQSGSVRATQGIYLRVFSFSILNNLSTFSPSSYTQTFFFSPIHHITQLLSLRPFQVVTRAHQIHVVDFHSVKSQMDKSQRVLAYQITLADLQIADLNVLQTQNVPLTWLASMKSAEIHVKERVELELLAQLPNTIQFADALPTTLVMLILVAIQHQLHQLLTK